MSPREWGLSVILTIAVGQIVRYDMDMMSSAEFGIGLQNLRLSEQEAARLLSVTPRSVRRWCDGSTDVPGPVEQAIRAWLRLSGMGLVWRPDGIPIWDIDQTALFREHAVELAAVIEKVKKRGGPSAPWDVNLSDRRARLGPVEVSFHVLDNKSFSPSCYTRKDFAPDIKRDWGLLEDAFYCIADAIAKAGKGWSKR